jgi:surfactin synthase thioesterase subunit
MILRYANEWLVGYGKMREVELRLFCFPYAGGGVRLFRDWPPHLPHQVEILSVQLPGRGSRMAADPVASWEQLLDGLAEAIAEFTDKPFAFFGHSLGGLLAFEMTRHLRRQGRPIPHGLFISACRAPHLLVPPKDPIHLLPDLALLERVKKWGGIPPEIFNYPEALSLFIRPLRGDLKLLETYQYREEDPLAIPLEVFGALQDTEVPEPLLAGWKVHTEERFLLTMVEGDHFFIEDRPEVLWRHLNDWARLHLAYNSF